MPLLENPVENRVNSSWNMEHNMTQFGNNTHPWQFVNNNRRGRRAPFPDFPPIVENLQYVNLAVIPFHICNVLLIILKRNLHTNVFILLANLSVSDITLQVFLYLMKSQPHSIPIRIAFSTFETSSILFTLAINLDRYMKVKHGLRYYELVLTSRLVAAITITWTFAVFFCVIPHVFANEHKKHLLVSFKLGFNIFCSFAMLFSSLWVVWTRNMHSRAIKRQENAVAKVR